MTEKCKIAKTKKDEVTKRDLRYIWQSIFNDQLKIISKNT